MIEAPEIGVVYPLTDGEIAVNNLESARQRAWSRFWRDPLGLGIAEYIVEQEQLTAQFVGDSSSLDRLGMLTNNLDRIDAESARTALIHAQVASMTHRFADARSYLAKAAASREPCDVADRLSLSIDQACGTRLESLLEIRHSMAGASGHLEDIVPLGALLADLGKFDEADRIYRRGLTEYCGASPFAVAWTCFQLGVLWGELVPEVQTDRAALWYRKAIEYLPCYLKARVHLAEIYLRCGRANDAEELLYPVVSIGDPEVFWRLADLLFAMRRFGDAEVYMGAARSGFEFLLRKHLLAFADHAAEFYLSGDCDVQRAFELASINLTNRQTLRAYELARATAIRAGKSGASSAILAAAQERWGGTLAFRVSPLSRARRNGDSLRA
jgi:tetratricopeptide (TPR) repeat protein